MEADFELLADVLQHYPRDYKDFQAVPVPGQNATLYGRVVESIPQAYHNTARVDTTVEIEQPVPEPSHEDQLPQPDTYIDNTCHAQTALEQSHEDGFEASQLTGSSVQSIDIAEGHRGSMVAGDPQLPEQQTSHSQASTSQAGGNHT